MGDNRGMPASGQQRVGSTPISRRTLARGVAWSAPVAMVAVAAPAYATSAPCQVQTNYDNLQVGTMPGALTFAPSAVTASIAYSSTGNDYDPTPGDTGRVARTSTSPAWNYIEVEMLSPLKRDDSITVTITLSQAVTNLSFRIHDIDTSSGQWVDHVVVNTPGFSYSRGTDVTGTGTGGDPFKNTKSQDQVIDSGKNHVDLTWAGSVTSVSFTYKAGADGASQNQHIGIGNICFSDCVANPHKSPVPADRLAVSRGSFTSGSSRALVPGRDN